uniref:Fucolectin tachylectin-4 pentraxin-1 domain-containing protein n=1 Tax=Branchiostoma floridae TaxID=7739 RepID=C3Y9P0_BRAFL|eukprot:XP_002607286.1 hypothetical protein BRAFLDRAFT_88235 [Branchiostoma floridae]
MACSGNRGEKCGGALRISVYQISGHATGPNIALGRPAFQCSVGHGGSAGRAVDGNRNPQWAGNSCTHTHGENDPWWYVDLGRSVTVDHITIVNRRDCCSERITPFDVHVGDSTVVTRNPKVGGHHSFCPIDTERVVPCGGRRGRYVGIRLPGKRRVLTLCEVEVYAAPNLALGKPTVQSAVAHGGFASRATDGCRDPNWGSQCCTHTPGQTCPWLRVDLGAQVSVQWVVVINRADCCRERLNGFTIHIGNDPQVDRNPRCGGHHTIPAGKNKDAINCNGQRGRYVGIRLPGHGRVLTVCEIEVYAGTVTRKRTSEVRGTEGQGCGEHQNEVVCYEVICGVDGKEKPEEDQDGMLTCPEPAEEEETGRYAADRVESLFQSSTSDIRGGGCLTRTPQRHGTDGRGGVCQFFMAALGRLRIAVCQHVTIGQDDRSVSIRSSRQQRAADMDMEDTHNLLRDNLMCWGQDSP